MTHKGSLVTPQVQISDRDNCWFSKILRLNLMFLKIMEIGKRLDRKLEIGKRYFKSQKDNYQVSTIPILIIKALSCI